VLHQDRVGPNRSCSNAACRVDSRTARAELLRRGPLRFASRWRRHQGLLQGGLHTGARAQGLFWLAPAIALVPAIPDLAVIPFGSNLGGAEDGHRRLNVGILYTFGIVSLGVYGIVLAGYASELEVPVPRRHPLQRADDLLRNRDGHERHPDLPLVGSLNLSDVITAHQARNLVLPNWFVLQACPRVLHLSWWRRSRRRTALPFDMPEAETGTGGGTTLNTARSSSRCSSWANTRR
jgi:hypothetical protein